MDDSLNLGKKPAYRRIVLDSSGSNDEEEDDVEHLSPESPSLAEVEDSDSGSGEEIETVNDSLMSVVEDSVVEIVSESSVDEEVLAKSMESFLQIDDEEEQKVVSKGDRRSQERKNELTAKLTRLLDAQKVADKLPDKGSRLQAEINGILKELDGLNKATAAPPPLPKQDVAGCSKPVDGSMEMIEAKFESSSSEGESSPDATADAKRRTPILDESSEIVESDFASGDKKAEPVKVKVEPVKPDFGGARPKVQAMVNLWQAKKEEDYWNQKYAVKVDTHRLYGGKMNDARENEAKYVMQDAIQTLHKAITKCPAETDETKDPPGLLVPLLEHQRQALTWLMWRESQVPAGGILADDMGLGKTLTMIALILCKKYERATTDNEASGDRFRKKALDNQKLVSSSSNLVVCPASVMHQWEKEIERRVKPGKLSVLIYHGTKRETSSSRLARFDVVLTTYGTLGSEIGSDKKLAGDDDSDDESSKKKKNTKSRNDGAVSPLLGVAWERIILDEAHQVRNHNTVQAQAVCKIPAAVRWALTGTPLQNQLKDLYSLLKFLRYSPFDEFAVWKEWIESKSEQAKSRLDSIVKGVLLRRTKEQKSAVTGNALVMLPPKRFDEEKLFFSPLERRVYDQMFKASQIYVKEFLKDQGQKDAELVKTSAQPVNNMVTGTDHERLGYKNPFKKAGPKRFNEAQEAGKGGGNLAILVMLLRLRQACVHFALTNDAMDIESFDNCGLEKEPEMDLVEKLNDMSLLEDDDLEETAAASDSKAQSVRDLFERLSFSTKVNAVLKRLEHFRNAGGDGPRPKFVLVSQWVQLLDILADHLEKRKISFTSITGKVTPEERSRRTDQFNDVRRGPQVMLLSISAGGVGLNLVGGNHLFVIDLHWNPALEKQACDRIYRVGQMRDVFIHKFVVKDSIEERVLLLQENKLRLAENVLSGADSKGLSRLTLHDLKFLFGLSSNIGASQGFPKPNAG